MPEFDQFNNIKQDFLENFSTDVTTLEKAAKSVGRTRQTIWNWRQDDSGFDKAVEKAKGKQEKMRLDAVEDSVFKQIMDGDAAASVIIFTLKNLGRGKWMDNPSHSKSDKKLNDLVEAMNENARN